ncbi:hypothetical protein DPMN_152195 [Dreissena polymorpha]|uniref:Uncharacterized protein n=1 Tax=Dreissena polymorpha TaxID=45954 RepID=A0A9D4FH16_DREPO|nr:hypothetical protein DPMN_152195 [Dreissena polymorpha]
MTAKGRRKRLKFPGRDLPINKHAQWLVHTILSYATRLQPPFPEESEFDWWSQYHTTLRKRERERENEREREREREERSRRERESERRERARGAADRDGERARAL